MGDLNGPVTVTIPRNAAWHLFGYAESRALTLETNADEARCAISPEPWRSTADALRLALEGRQADA